MSQRVLANSLRVVSAISGNPPEALDSKVEMYLCVACHAFTLHVNAGRYCGSDLG